MSRDLPTNWTSIRKEALERDDYQCANCGRVGKYNDEIALVVHHIVERKHGGTNRLQNLQTLCVECHASITHDRPAPTKYGSIGQEKEPSWPGSFKMHLLVALFTGWWTFGLGNILFEIYNYRTRNDDRSFEEWLEDGKDRLEEFEDQMKDNLFNGCPVCGLPTLEHEGNFPQVWSCKSCSATLERKLWSWGLVPRYTLTEGDSELLGETRKISEWRRMNPRQTKKEQR